MTVAEYADLGNHDSFCYWLEYGTKELGLIGGIRLQKFELWKSDPSKVFRDGRFRLENGYAWNANKGGTLEEAFQRIKALIIRIVELSQEGDWEEIDQVPFNAIGKWKIAFLFSGKRLLPVYSRRALKAIAAGLGLTIAGDAPVSIFQRGILSQKGPEEEVLTFSIRVYFAFAAKDTSRQYFIIGSMYNGSDSVMKQFLERSCVAMGWIDWMDFSDLMGAGRPEIDRYVDDNYHDPKPRAQNIKSYFRIFSKILEGDIIAVKSKGSHGELTIIAYARVVCRNGEIYFHDEGDLGHCIHVEFLDANFEKYVGENYAWTIHQLTREKDKQTFYDVFGWYSGEAEEHGIGVSDEEEDFPTASGESETEEGFEEGYTEKSEESFERSAGARVFVGLVHNVMQNRFMKYLEQTYPDDLLSGEKRYVDARRLAGEVLYLYEIKPDASVYTCIRQGIGQLLDYRFQDRSGKDKVLVVVGQNEPNSDDQRFIDYMRETLRVEFQYLAFDSAKMRVKQF